MALATSEQTTTDGLDCADLIAKFAQGFSTETTPGGAAKVAHFGDYLNQGTDVYITFLPGTEFSATIETAKRLHAEGFNAVPHIASRSIPSLAELDRYLGRLRDEAGVREVLAIAGSVARPVGPFPDTRSILETGLLERYGIARIGIAGHPEGSPDISSADLNMALHWKNQFVQTTSASLHIVTQMCFEPAPVVRWEKSIREAGNRLRVRVGIPGLASVKTLLNYAKLCGIGPSAKFLTRQTRNVARLLTVSTPDVLLRQLASGRRFEPQNLFLGCHVYPLGGLARTARWMNAVAEGRFSLDDRRGGFVVEDLEQ